MSAKVVSPIKLTAFPQHPVGPSSVQSSSDKIILPPSILQSLISQYTNNTTDPTDLPSPLLFQITNPANKKFTHVGVLEFSAEESTVLLPLSVQRNLGITTAQDASNVLVSLKALPKASSITIAPQESYEDSIDWKYLLEARFRSNLTALTVGDTIDVTHPSDCTKCFTFQVKEAQPENAVCIVDTDVELNIVNPTNGNLDPMNKPSKSISPPVIDPDSVGYFQNIELNTDLPVQILNPLHKRLTLSSSEPLELYVGTDEDTSSDTFLLTNLGNSTLEIDTPELCSHDLLYAVVLSSKTKTFELRSSYTAEEASSSTSDTQPCPNCKQDIPRQSFQLHSTFCARNNLVCECGQVFNRRSGIPDSHWHCSTCQPMVAGVDYDSYELHNRMMHTPQTCSCDPDFVFPSFLSLARHKATECPNKLHICRFCHLKVPRERASAVDTLQGLSGHESYCGNKTADCPVCHRAVRLRDLESHMSYHNMSRIAKTADIICSNVNCVKPVKSSNNNMNTGLCSTCFGPLHSTLQDPDGKKLAQRIERKYMIQLSGGCGKPWCLNEHCATASGQKLPMVQAVEKMKCLVALATDQHLFFFCVDEAVTKRKLFVEFESGNNVYDHAWLCMAIDEAKGNEQQARQWLELNSPKKSEIV